MSRISTHYRRFSIPKQIFIGINTRQIFAIDCGIDCYGTAIFCSFPIGMKGKRTTLKDIARELGISTSTVSRALRDHPDIRQDTKDQVAALARTLEYQPNFLARSLKETRTELIGVIVPSISYHFYSGVISGIEQVVQAHGYSVMVCQTEESLEREIKQIRHFAAGRVDGLIAAISGQTNDDAHFRYLQRSGMPLVFCNRVADTAADKVMVDNVIGGRQAVSHLIEQGYRRIAYLGGPDFLAISNDRYAGYVAAHEAAGIACEPDYLIHCDFSEARAMEATDRLLALPNPPEAIFTVSDRVAVGVLRALRNRGLRIPEDMALIGFNDDPICSLLSPALSSIAQPKYEMGQLAARMLLEQIEGTSNRPRTHMLKTELQVREST